MIKTREYTCATNPNTLCETYSTLGKNLIQQETGITYGDSVIDVLEGHDENGNPYSRFHYTEDGSKPGDSPPNKSFPDWRKSYDHH